MIRKLSEVTWNYLPAVCRPSRKKNEMREICVRFQTDKGFMAFPSEKYFHLETNAGQMFVLLHCC